MLPWLVIGVLVIIVMAALLVDGGTLLANRRQAQNAADAGALAGARVYCDGGSNTEIETAITKYVTENGAVLVEWYPTNENVGNNADDIAGLVKGEVVVTTTIDQGSFFAKVMGEDNLRVTATAGAGCFAYKPHAVLPIAWSCREPAAGSDSPECDILKLDYEDVAEVADDYITTFPEFGVGEPDDTQIEAISNDLFDLNETYIYIVMDSEAVCGEDIKCDLFDDGVARNQLESGGNRGWLNLLGSSSATGGLEGLIDGSKVAVAKIHTWYSGISGNRPVVYDALQTRLDEIVWIPVFNWICDDVDNGQATAACLDGAHNDPYVGVSLPGDMEEDYILGNPATPMYHIVAYVPFFPTCVHYAPGSGGGGTDHCPGFNLAMTVNEEMEEEGPGKSGGGQSIWNSVNYFEGYFVDPDTLPPSEDIALGGIDMGYYTISLTR